MKKILLLIATICLLLTLVSCGEPEVIEYHIDENGHLIGTCEDATTVDLGSLSDSMANGIGAISSDYQINEKGHLIGTFEGQKIIDFGVFSNGIANGVVTVSVGTNGCYIINGTPTEIKAKLPQSYAINTDGQLIVTYTDATTESLGKFGADAINTIDTIAVSEDGYYILNNIKTEIPAFGMFEVKFDTGYDASVKAQVVKDGGKVERPQLARPGYTLEGWFCNGEEWHFNSNTVTDKITLTARWKANNYTVAFSTGTGETIPNKTVTYGNTYSLPTLTRDGYTFKGWECDGKLIASTLWDIAKNCTLIAKWQVNEYVVTLDANGGTVEKNQIKVTYGQPFALPVATNEYGAFIGWTYNGTPITDASGQSLANWTYLDNITVTTSWTIELSTVADLQKLYQYPNGHFKLMNDIVISSAEWIPVGTDDTPFTGEIDGNNHSIIGLKITKLQGDSKYYGFIGKAGSGKIFDLTLSLVNINLPTVSNTVYVGSLIAYNDGALLNNISTNGAITVENHSADYSSYAGGIAGYSTVDTFENCTNVVNVSAKSAAGGIIGYSQSASSEIAFKNNENNGVISAEIAGGLIGESNVCVMLNCINNGAVTGVNMAGGLAGATHGAIDINRCVNTATITVSTAEEFTALTTGAGGLVGLADGRGNQNIIQLSYNVGNVTSSTIAGGVVGYEGITIEIKNCYNSGAISTSGLYAGGVAGVGNGATVKQCVNYGTIKAPSGYTATFGHFSTCVDSYYNCTLSGLIKSIKGVETREKYAKEFYTQTMFWSEEDWIFYDDKLPTLK